MKKVLSITGTVSDYNFQGAEIEHYGPKIIREEYLRLPSIFSNTSCREIEVHLYLEVTWDKEFFWSMCKKILETAKSENILIVFNQNDFRFFCHEKTGLHYKDQVFDFLQQQFTLDCQSPLADHRPPTHSLVFFSENSAKVLPKQRGHFVHMTHGTEAFRQGRLFTETAIVAPPVLRGSFGPGPFFVILK